MGLKNKKCYAWFDLELYQKGRRLAELIEESLQRNGGSWEQEWLDVLPSGLFEKVKVERDHTQPDSRVKKSFDEVKALKQWDSLKSVHRRILAEHISKAFEVREGRPSLRGDCEMIIRQLCTQTIPEKWRPLCDLLRDNQEALIRIIKESRKRNIELPLSVAFDDDGFSIEKFFLHICH